MSVLRNQYIRGNLHVNGEIETNAIDALTASTLVVGNNQATKVEIAKNSVETEFKGPVNLLNYIVLNDITAPSNPASGQGRLYKKIGNDGIFWKPETSGAEVDLTQVGTSSIFGSEYQVAESANTSSTSSNTLQQKIRLTTSFLSGGAYRIGWYYNWSLDNNKSSFEARVQIDDATTIHNHLQEPHDRGNNQLFVVSGFYHANLSGGVHNIDIDYRPTENGNAASISNVRLEFWRVQ